MRKENFSANDYYHVFNKGVSGGEIFIDDEDRVRFVFLITHFQSPTQIYNVSWYTQSFIKKNSFGAKKERIEHVLKKRNVELIAFNLMPSHFDILIKNLEDGILSVYMHRVLTAYSKYFNAKYGKRGHVFHGPFTAMRVKNHDHLLQLSAQIHLGPMTLGGWSETFEKYPFSSYQDYIGPNRWSHFLSTKTILKQFKNSAKYKDFVLENLAKNDDL